MNVITYSLWHHSLLMYEDEGKKLPHQYSSRIQPSVNQRWWWYTFQISLKIKTENTILSIKYTLSTCKRKLNDKSSYKKIMIRIWYIRSLLFLYWTYSNKFEVLFQSTKYIITYWHLNSKGKKVFLYIWNIFFENEMILSPLN